ncbi:MAG: hypothetical protein H6Q59_3169 [Firmicutes bacterium]|nr:hypothetical protein [Bacillota bacterium]
MVWLILSMIIIAGIIFVLLRRLDLSLALSGSDCKLVSERSSNEIYTLVLGDSPIADNIFHQLQNHQIACVQIKDENKLDKTKNYNHLFAVSSNDLSNMLVSIIIHQISESCMTIALCNSLQDRPIFEQNNIPYLLAAEADANMLLCTMKLL